MRSFGRRPIPCYLPTSQAPYTAEPPMYARFLSRNCQDESAQFSKLLTKLDLHGDGAGGNGLSWLDGIYHDGVEDILHRQSTVPGRGAGKLLIEESDTQTSARALRSRRRPGRFGKACGMARSIRSTDSNTLILPATGCQREIWKERRSGYPI